MSFPSKPTDPGWKERFGYPDGWDGDVIRDYVVTPKLILTEQELIELNTLIDVRPTHYHNDNTRSLNNKAKAMLAALIKVREIEDKKSCA